MGFQLKVGLKMGRHSLLPEISKREYSNPITVRQDLTFQHLVLIYGRMDEVYELRMGLRLASEVCEQQRRGIVVEN